MKEIAPGDEAATDGRVDALAVGVSKASARDPHVPPNESAMDIDHDEDASARQLQGETAAGMIPADGGNAQATGSSRKGSKSPAVQDTQSTPASTHDPALSPPTRPGAVSPDTSPAEDDMALERGGPADRKPIAVPKQPDTPDSSQHVPIEDPSAMNVGTAPVQPSTVVANDRVRDSPVSPKPSATDAESRIPSMRIDSNGTAFKPTLASGVVESPAPLTTDAATPRRQQPATLSGEDSSRRATRISSGVLQKKSVSEILNEAQRSASADSPMSESRDSVGATERRDKERSKLSTVVFAKPQKGADGEIGELVMADPNSPRHGPPKDRDYLYTLFENKAHSMTRNGSMNYLIQNAHKTLSTADHLVDYQMQTDCRILKRIYQLQERGRWALRQHKRAEEPPRPTSHWDLLLDHAKWMRTDFREERKWKLAAAHGLAEECAFWVNASPEVRKRLQVKVRLPTVLPEGTTGPVQESDQHMPMDDGPDPAMSSQPTPDLIPSHEDDSMSDDIPDPRHIQASIAPAAIFSLGASDFTFSVDRTPAFDKLLNELPIYEPAPIIPDYSKSDLAERLDARWKTDIIPVSKYAIEKLKIKDDKPRRKKSRYEYDLEMSPTSKTDPLPPRAQNVALFMTENKHIRDRIHPGHSFRPPSEHPMPTQEFFQTRSSSQWTTAEDDELRRLVKDYSYNWSLISSCLTPRSLYTSGADRRTPWECFERWIGLEGLPADMSKTPYFKTYSGRIEAAGRHVLAQIEEAQRRAGANVQIPARKRTTQPVRVDRKRTQRHLAMLDAMRKNAKKRETALQKQQHQSDLAAMRKLNNSEINQPKAPFKTPREFAALRQERDAKRAEQQEMYRQQLLAHQRAAQQAQRGQNTPLNGLPNGMPNNPGGMRGPAGGMQGMPNGNLQVPNGGRPHPAVMAAMNGMQMPPGMMGPKNIAQAQMQANMARGMATSPEQLRMMQQASKVQQQQEMMRQAQTQGGQHSSPNGAAASLANGNAPYNMVNANGAPSPHANASSPRSQNSTTGQLSSGHVPVLNQIANKIKQQYPNMTDEEVQKHASTQIQVWQQQATASTAGQPVKRPQQTNQAALNAAVGAMNSAAHASNNVNAMAGGFPQGMPQMTPEQMQQFQRMRMMQAQQQNAAGRQPQQGPGQMHGMNGMGMGGMPMQGAQAGVVANSPVMNMARPVSQGGQGQVSRSATPSGRSGSLSGPQGALSPGAQQQRPGSSRAMVGTPQAQTAPPASTGTPQPPPQGQQQPQQAS